MTPYKTMAQYFTFPCLIFFIQTTFVAAANAGEVYRWINEEGQIQYSYTRPAANYTALDDSGLKISEHKETETPSDEINNTAQESNKPPSQEADTTTKEAQKARDEILLSTYLNVEELTAVYLKKKQAISKQIEHFEASLEMLLVRQLDIREQLAIANDRSIKRKLQDHIADSEEIQTAYEENIRKQKNRLAQIDVQFLADKKRLTELLAKKVAEKKETD
jgi:t-SNARE complex subunit (syntaxin)